MALAAATCGSRWQPPRLAAPTSGKPHRRCLLAVSSSPRQYCWHAFALQRSPVRRPPAAGHLSSHPSAASRGHGTDRTDLARPTARTGPRPADGPASRASRPASRASQIGQPDRPARRASRSERPAHVRAKAPRAVGAFAASAFSACRPSSSWSSHSRHSPTGKAAVAAPSPRPGTQSRVRPPPRESGEHVRLQAGLGPGPVSLLDVEAVSCAAPRSHECRSMPPRPSPVHIPRATCQPPLPCCMSMPDRTPTCH